MKFQGSSSDLSLFKCMIEDKNQSTALMGCSPLLPFFFWGDPELERWTLKVKQKFLQQWCALFPDFLLITSTTVDTVLGNSLQESLFIELG